MMPLPRLGLGGHSFISKLGNDPPAGTDEQVAIVAACLDAGVTLVDTTYHLERVALGRVHERLGRRREQIIAAWNFFRPEGDQEALYGPTPLEPSHLGVMLDELRTDVLDVLVIHTHGDCVAPRELELANRWKSDGRVTAIALGMCYRKHLDNLPADSGVEAVFTPFNAFCGPDVRAVLRQAREMGLSVVALSPFVRGFKFDALAAGGIDKRVAADRLIRYVLSEPAVDSLVISMRRADYVPANTAIVNRGPLSDEEMREVERWSAIAT